MTITFVGHGYVGLVTASIFADFGNTVYVIGRNPEKIGQLADGKIPIYEPGLEEIVKRNINAGRLIFTTEYAPAIPNSEIVFTAVGTPPTATGDADLENVLKVAEQIGKNLNGYTVVATKSTVPVGTNKRVRELINSVKNEKDEFDIASCPEFLREGSAISDTMYPDRVVIGTESVRARNLLLELHKPITGERVLTNLESAELIKYASNSFLATKISFANAIAKLAELSGADALQVLDGIGFDKRIGNMFLKPGPGYGGSCFPKDVKALIAIARDCGYDFQLLKSVEEINQHAWIGIVEKCMAALGDLQDKKIGVLGLAFKPDTDDMRESPSIPIIRELQKKGAHINAYDPAAMKNSMKILENVHFKNNAVETAEGVDLILVLTDWNEFKELDLNKLKEVMRSYHIVDARNIYSPQKARDLGFSYIGVGR